MRQQFQEVVEGTRDALLSLRAEMEKYGGLTDDETLVRYVQQHRNRPRAILGFVTQNLPDGADPYNAGVEYERTMEAALRRRRRDHAA